MPGQDQRLVLRVDDTPHAFKLVGKQGYGKARGLWQTVYLEARPAARFLQDLPGLMALPEGQHGLVTMVLRKKIRPGNTEGAAIVARLCALQSGSEDATVRQRCKRFLD